VKLGMDDQAGYKGLGGVFSTAGGGKILVRKTGKGTSGR